MRDQNRRTHRRCKEMRKYETQKSSCSHRTFAIFMTIEMENMAKFTFFFSFFFFINYCHCAHNGTFQFHLEHNFLRSSLYYLFAHSLTHSPKQTPIDRQRASQPTSQTSCARRRLNGNYFYLAPWKWHMAHVNIATMLRKSKAIKYCTTSQSQSTIAFSWKWSLQPCARRCIPVYVARYVCCGKSNTNAK